MTRKIVRRAVPAVLLLTVAAAMAAERREDPVLATVNGETVRASDLDAVILAGHQDRDMASLDAAALPNYLDKAVNDRLLVQDARAMGLDEEEALLREADELLAREAVRAYTRANYEAPDSVDSLALRGFFDEYYGRVLLRQISARGRGEADSLRAAVVAGASMDSLARARSLDSRRIHGGLHNLKFWADVERPLRRAARGLRPGELSETFPYRQAHAFLRVEEIHPPREEDFAAERERIHGILLAERREETWAAFLDSLEALTPLRVHEKVLDSVRADSAIVFRGEFRRSQPVIALEAGGERLAAGELRRTISHTAMVNGTAPFDSIFALALEDERQGLLLRHHAHQAGLFDDQELREKRRRRLEELLIQTYLNEVIVPEIVFNRQEFQDYYDAHPERFRGPDQVRLEMALLESEAKAREMDARLREGADFDFIKRQYAGEGGEEGSVRWSSAGVFSDAIQEQLRGMEVGDCSRPVETRGGWLIFRLDGRRPGEPRPLSEVEMQLREIMFQRKFNELLDAHLALLKERSEIDLNQEAIDDYFGREP